MSLDQKRHLRARRQLLQTLSVGGGIALLGGFGFVRTLYARQRLEDELMGDAWPLLTDKAHHELQVLPAQACDEIRSWMQNVCLNSAEFVRVICSSSFGRQLAACQTEPAKEALLLAEFFRTVVSPSEMLNRIRVIAKGIGVELDRNWGKCCVELSDKWKLLLEPYSHTMEQTLEARLEPVVKSQLGSVIKRAKGASERPMLGDVIGEIGQSAVMLLPLARFSNFSAPVFVLVAFHHLASYVLRLFGGNPVSDHQAAVSDQLTVLADRMGAEFESEVRRRIADLHGMQQHSLEEVAHEYATNSVRFI